MVARRIAAPFTESTRIGTGDLRDRKDLADASAIDREPGPCRLRECERLRLHRERTVDVTQAEQEVTLNHQRAAETQLGTGLARIGNQSFRLCLTASRCESAVGAGTA